MTKLIISDELIITLSLHINWTLFLWSIRMIPGGCNQASPSTCTGTPSLPSILITMERHCAIRCLCKFMILDAPICIEPNTATTWKICEGCKYKCINYALCQSFQQNWNLNIYKTKSDIPQVFRHQNLKEETRHHLLCFPKSLYLP